MHKLVCVQLTVFTSVMATVLDILVFLCTGCYLLSLMANHAAASSVSFGFEFSNKSTYNSKILVQGDTLLQDNLVDLTVQDNLHGRTLVRVG